MNPSDRSAAIADLAGRIKGIRTAMLTTADEQGRLRSRPMATQDMEPDGTLWFFTCEDSPKVDEVERERQVNVSYSDDGRSLWVSVSGTAAVVTDRAKIEELWKPILKAWFPKGLEDPDLALLRVSPSAAEYWDAPSSKMVQVAGIAKAALSGEEYRPGEHRKVELG
ncbi:MAG TPA: pyridoxamine 5'-phosphate oxidase family protein [Deinococcales bacterium]|nr:pyridoxamine 5'-phosphate oxidase family protein [Deinococcales bacterium]